MARRDKSRDGFKNHFETFVLTHFKFFWNWVNSNENLKRKANRKIINTEIFKIPTRPYPFSTRSPYSSWDSLTDRTYSGLHLPPLDWEPLTDELPLGINLTPAAQFEGNLPPVEDLEALYRMEGETKQSPKSNVLFPYFVQWFTDGFLRTERDDPARNISNHHIDMCTVYGLHPEMTNQLRAMEGGRLKSQTINGEEYPPFYYDDSGNAKAEFSTLLHLPEEEEVPADKKAKLFAMGVEIERVNVQPGYVMLNVLCLREHNRLAGLLAKSYPKWDDERLFQVARNILIVEVMKIVVEEYINHIAPYHFHFIVDPPSFADANWYRLNWMTIEFSLVYRWHSMLPDTLEHQGETMRMEDSQWDNAMILDHGLGNFFEESSNQPAGSLSLFNTPEFLVPVELAGVRLGRANKLRSYNDYRELFKYPRITSFRQLTSNDRLAAELERLYKHPDNLELYVGLYAEDLGKNSALPPMVMRMVGIDAFSQAFTSPLLAGNLFNKETFSPVGWDEIMSLKTLSQLVHRNVPPGKEYKVSFYRSDWKRS